jgi:putative transcriptional regulator
LYHFDPDWSSEFLAPLFREPARCLYLNEVHRDEPGRRRDDEGENKKTQKPGIGGDLIAGMENALAHARGRKRAARETVVRVRVPETIDVAALRRRLGMSQAAFAARFGFSVKNIQNWEQGARQPEGPARAYLLVIDRKPEAVQDALG